MQDTLKKLNLLMTERDKKISIGIFFCMVMMGLLEVVGIALVLPFMMLVSDPDALLHHKKLALLFDYFGFARFHSFLFTIGVLVFLVLIFGNAFSAFTTWLMTRFSSALEHKFSVRLLEKYLYQPYAFYLNRNTSDLAKNILTEVSHVTEGLIRPGLDLFSRSVLVAMILILLLFVNVKLAFVMALVLGGAYGIVFSVLRPMLFHVGKTQLASNQARFKASSECMGGIKDIKLLGAEAEMTSRYSPSSSTFSKMRALGVLMGVLPRYLLEAIAFGGIVLIVLYLLAIEKDLNRVMPLLALYAIASYRLMPSLQTIFKSMALVRVSLPRLDVLCDDLMKTDSRQSLGDETRTLVLNEQIALHQLHFKYSEKDSAVLNDLSLLIKANTTVGFVGSTGAGKTTIVDLILGLLSPTAGNILIDGERLTAENIRAWQKNIGYVPQHIFLCDDTLTRNIAFGVSDEAVDMNRVKTVAKMANLEDFILALPDTYQATVGDRGVRLSGGQRQRIGIARALYRNPAVLVFDEATSALDNITENAVLEAVNALGRKKTIIMIAHRLSTVVNCDVIYVLEQGKIVGQGSYRSLLNTCPQFKALELSGHAVVEI